MFILSILLTADMLSAAGPTTAPTAGTPSPTTNPSAAMSWPQPWHMVDQWWTFKEPIPHFKSLSVDVTLDRDVPSDVNLYISPVGLGSFGQKHDFYGGLQTNANGWPSKTDHTRDFLGHGAIFSEWGKQLSTAQAEGIEGTHYEAADYEGDFLSVRHAVAFGKGTYTYSLTVDRTENVDDKPFTWIACKILDHQTSKEQLVGTLRFPGTDLTLSPSLANFVEIYSTEKIPKSKVPAVTVTFAYPKVNGTCPPIKWVSVIHPSGKESSASPDLAHVSVDGSSVNVEIASEPFARDAKERRYRLHPAMPTTQPAAAQAQHPTAEQAKAAFVELVRARSDMGGAEAADGLTKLPLVDAGEGICKSGKLTLMPNKDRYVAYIGGEQGMHEFSGTFSLKDGKWLATLVDEVIAEPMPRGR